MSDSLDIRDRDYLSHADIARLNFIRRSLPFVFRRHYREGLRSHIFEVHDQSSIRNERKGIRQEGISVFPRSIPRYMLRLFRYRFRSLGEALAEIERFQILQKFLSLRYIAISSEFLVEYSHRGQGNILLCGLQEFVQGEVFDPWGFERSPESLPGLIEDLLAVHPAGISHDRFSGTLFSHVRSLVQGSKNMIVQAGLVPDLSGVGNLILTPEGLLKLVDINNISPVSFQEEIYLDDKGYPVCDKSIEVLAILEQRLLQAEIPPHDGLYDFFLHPDRLMRVRELERDFRRGLRETNALPKG